jgi:hypothetical protein
LAYYFFGEFLNGFWIRPEVVQKIGWRGLLPLLGMLTLNAPIMSQKEENAFYNEFFIGFGIHFSLGILIFSRRSKLVHPNEKNRNYILNEY